MTPAQLRVAQVYLQANMANMSAIFSSPNMESLSPEPEEEE